MVKNIIVAIDGPAAAGKSTTAKAVGQSLGFLYVDTGAMYRAITYLAIEKEYESEEDIVSLSKIVDLKLRFENGITRVFVDQREITDFIRTPEVNAKVSQISKIAGVRTEMVKIQKSFGKLGNLIAEGRDTTTVVFPDSELKIYLTASLEERALRRYNEYQQKNILLSLDEVKKNLVERDKIDSEREISPLKKADNAIEIDTTKLTIEEQVEKVLGLIKNLKSQIINKC